MRVLDLQKGGAKLSQKKEGCSTDIEKRNGSTIVVGEGRRPDLPRKRRHESGRNY